MSSIHELEGKCSRLLHKLTVQEEELNDAKAERDIALGKIQDFHEERAQLEAEVLSLRKQLASQADGVGGAQCQHVSVDAALEELVQRKQMEVDSALSAPVPKSGGDNTRREVERVFSDVLETLTAFPADYTNKERFLSVGTVQDALGNNSWSHHDGVQSLLKAVKSFATFSLDGTVLPHVPAASLPCEAVARTLRVSSDLAETRREFDVVMQRCSSRAEAAREYKEQIDSLLSAIQVIDEHEANFSAAVSIDDVCRGLDEVAAEATQIDELISDNASTLRYKCGRAREEVARRAITLEKEVMSCETGLKQHREKTAEITQHIQGLLEELNSVFEDMFKTVRRHKELKTNIDECQDFQKAVQRREDVEIERHGKIGEGAKTTLVISAKVKELLKREQDAFDATVHKQRDLFKRAKIAYHERLYAVCREHFEVAARHSITHRQTVRKEQHKISSAHRIMSSGVLTQDIERRVQADMMQQSVKNLNEAKEALVSHEAEMERIRSLLHTTGTLDVLGAGVTFLDEYEAQFKSENVATRLDELVSSMKTASELLVQCVDGEESANGTVVQQVFGECASSLLDLRSNATRLSLVDDGLRTSAISKLRRYRRMISDSLQDLGEVNPAAFDDVQVPVHDVLTQNDEVLGLLSSASDRTPSVSSTATASVGARRGPPLPRNAIGTYGSVPSKPIATAHHRDPRAISPDFDQDIGGMEARFGSREASTESRFTASEVPSSLPVNPARSTSTYTNNNPPPMSGNAVTSALPPPQPPQLPLPPTTTLPAWAPHSVIPIRFGKCSAKLTVTNGGRHVRKGVQHMEISDSCVLGNIGFSSGRHSWRIRLGPHCDKLMVGVSDGSLPVDGYCNSLRYKGCYFLHLGSGTLWSPFLGLQRAPYAESMCNVGGEVTVVLDMNTRQLSFGWGEEMLPVAFEGIQVPPNGQMFPSFEVYSNGCEFDIID